MKNIIEYQCEICNSLYDTEIEAIECENKGTEQPLAKVGDEVEMEIKVSGGFDPWYKPVKVREIEDMGHFLLYKFDEYDQDIKEWYEFSKSCYGNSEYRERIISKK